MSSCLQSTVILAVLLCVSADASPLLFLCWHPLDLNRGDAEIVDLFEDHLLF